MYSSMVLPVLKQVTAIIELDYGLFISQIRNEADAIAFLRQGELPDSAACSRHES